MRIGTLFSGIGAPEQVAIRVFGDKFKHVFACEWDKFARQSFKALYEIEDEHFHVDINEMDGNQYSCKKVKADGVSDSQMYKQAGNSITVAVMEMILRQVEKALIGETNGTLF